jgi:hypothetical protein
LEESKHSDEEYSTRTIDRSTESSDDSGLVKEPLLIFMLRQLHQQHVVSAKVE